MDSYPAVRANADRLCQETSRQIERLITENGYKLGFPVQHRVKEAESIKQKIIAKSYDISELTEMDDIAGMRITLLFKRDLTPLVDKLKESFEILEESDTADRLGDDQFGYSSIHLIVKLGADWLRLPTFKGLENFKIEIQLRTLAQHTWAASSHALQYKREDSIPRPLRRSINRIAALLEMVDLEIERLLDEQANYVDGEIITTDNELNVNTLERLLNEVYPGRNRSDPEPYDSVLQDVKKTGIDSITRLREIVSSTLEQVMEEDIVAAQERRGEKSLLGDNAERVNQGYFYAHVGLLRRALAIAYPEAYAAIQAERRAALEGSRVGRGVRKKVRAPQS